MEQLIGSEFSILIVDDNSKNIQLLGSYLRRKGYVLSFATGGRKALEMCLRKTDRPFDLVLLDVMMPGMDGFEVCRRLKQPDSPAKDVPVIFLTARTGAEDAVKGFKLGAVDYVTKPFNMAELSARVETHLELKRTRERLQESLEQVKLLSGLLPICSNCKKIRDDKGYWIQIENYIRDHSEADFSHGICPECAHKLYPRSFPDPPEK